MTTRRPNARPTPSPRRFSEGGPSRLRGVEIFAAGVHRGKSYTTADLDQIATNFRKVSSGPRPLLRVPAVLGHEETQEFLERSDLPAAAWPTRVWRSGRVLKADFDDVPAPVARLLKGKAYRTVSSEIYDTPPEGVPGEGKMLRRVAFLGGDIPQIKSLADIPVPETHTERFATHHRCVLRFREAIKGKRAGAGYYTCFSEVQSMSRDEMIQALADAGVDTAVLTEAVPDEILAEWLRTLDGAGQEPEPEEQPAPEEGQMADDGDADDKGDKDKPAEDMADDQPADQPADGQDKPATEDMADDSFPAPKDDDDRQKMAEKCRRYLEQYGDAQTYGDMDGANRADTYDPASSPDLSALGGGSFGSQHPKSVTMKYTEKGKPGTATKQPGRKAVNTINPTPARDNATVAELAKLKSQLAEIQRFAEQEKAARKKATVKAELDALVQAGKVLPAEIDAGLADVLCAADSATVMKFSEGGKTVETTAFDRLLAALKARPVLVKFGERIAGGKAKTSSEDDEVAKVEEHFEQFSEQLTKVGVTKDKLVSGFKAERKRRPSVTADEFVGNSR